MTSLFSISLRVYVHEHSWVEGRQNNTPFSVFITRALLLRVQSRSFGWAAAESQVLVRGLHCGVWCRVIGSFCWAFRFKSTPETRPREVLKNKRVKNRARRAAAVHAACCLQHTAALGHHLHVLLVQYN